MQDRDDHYSGCDATGEVWRILDTVIKSLDSEDVSEKYAESCQRAYDLESDTNWRSFALGLKGLVYHRLGYEPEAKTCFENAIRLAAKYAENFDDVVSVYCQASYNLGSILFDDENQTEKAILAFLRCLPYMHDVYPDLFIGNIFGFLDTLNSRLGREKESAVFAEAALYFHGLEPAALESLMYSYANLLDLQRARAVYHVLRETVNDSEALARIEDFATRRL